MKMMMLLPLSIQKLTKMKNLMMQLLPLRFWKLHLLTIASFSTAPLIEPKFDGFSVKIGDISCIFIDSCKNIVDCDDSVFVASEEDGYVKVLEPELKIRNSVYGFSEASEHFITHAHPVRLRSVVYGVAAVRPFAL
jgi:hypothetical protein